MNSTGLQGDRHQHYFLQYLMKWGDDQCVGTAAVGAHQGMLLLQVILKKVVVVNGKMTSWGKSGTNREKIVMADV